MKIVIKHKFDNWNDTIYKCRTNYRYANAQKQKEMKIVKEALKEIEPITDYPVKIACLWHVKSLRGDLDNKSLKSVLDQMQKSNILANDNMKYVREINHKIIKDNEEFLEMEVNKYES